MNFFTILFMGIFILIFNFTAKSQVTNLVVNGSSSSFIMTSGDIISWSYNVPTAGATTLIDIWYDVNGNRAIDAGDKLYQAFEQTDNDTVGQNGPPDMSNIPGKVSFSMPIGIAPGNYILSFTEGGSTIYVAGTINALTSPAYTISGKVTPPSGKSAANIFVEVQRKDKYQPSFWDALTDANGNYTIGMTSDTAGNPWTIELVSNPFLPNIVSPAQQQVTISGNLTGINFSFTAAAAQVGGTVKDENGNMIVNTDVSIYAGSQNNPVNYDVKTNINGVYQIGLTQSDLSQSTGGWSLNAYSESSNGYTIDKLDGSAYVNSISPGDSIARNLIIYNANSTITGKVTLDGIAPGFPIQLVAVNRDSAQSTVFSDGSTGNFSFPVTDKIYNYQINYINTSQVYYMNNIIVHPGETNVIVNLSTTPLAVKSGTSGVPKVFSLGQNYPNPFNPSTEITYQLAAAGKVALKVYNILGQEVATLVNGEKQAGRYKVEFNGNNLSSGIYLYKLSAGNFTSVRKMILIK